MMENDQMIGGMTDGIDQQVAPILEGTDEQSNIQEISGDVSYVDTVSNLSCLYETLKQPIPEKPSAKYITDTAHQLVDSLNNKRKYDTQLLEEFRQAMEAQMQKCVQALEQHLCQVYNEQNAQVDSKLQELFSCLNRIAAAETDLDNFKGSLKKLYEEMLCSE